MVIDNNNNVFLILVGERVQGAIVANDPRRAIGKFIRTCGFELVDQYAATFIGCNRKLLIRHSNFIDFTGYLENARIAYYLSLDKKLRNGSDPLLVIATTRIHYFDELATYISPKGLLVYDPLLRKPDCADTTQPSL